MAAKEDKESNPVIPEGTGNAAEDAKKVELTWEETGVSESIIEAVHALKWAKPSPIQAATIKPALEGRDIIGVAETGSGKTGAFCIPVLHNLLQNPSRLFALVMAPTRELAYQIQEQFDALGSVMDVKTVCIVGGMDMMQQAIALAKKPHIIIATPGRLVDHLEHTKGFTLRTVKYLVLDEADRMLGMDFEEEITKILEVMPRDRRTYLFSATMTSKVKKLQRAALRNPAKVQVNTKYTTVKTLVQEYLFIPEKFKDCYLTYVLNEHAGQSALVFVRTCNEAQRCALLLRNLGFKAICLHGKMQQQMRLGSLNKFKAGARNILIATDVASRGLDIPAVDLVLNFSIPANAKDYVHRVGRTARAGRSGRAISFVTQYDVEMYQRIETLLEKRLNQYPADQDTVLVMLERVQEAQRIASMEMREMDRKKGGMKRGRAEDEGKDFKRQKIRPGKSYGAVPKTGGRAGGRGHGGRNGNRNRQRNGGGRKQKF